MLSARFPDSAGFMASSTEEVTSTAAEQVEKEAKCKQF